MPFSASLIDAGVELHFNDQSVEPAVVFAARAPTFLREPLFAAIPGRIGSHAATLAAFSGGELLAAWYSYSGPGELDGSAIYMARRGADGPWSDPWVHLDRPEADGNPVLYAEQDRVWLFSAATPGGWSIARIEVQVSENRGSTWSAPAPVGGPLGSNVRFPPVRTADGGLLLPAYNDLLPQAQFFTSADGSAWDLVGAVAAEPPGIQPSIARLPDDSLLAVMRNSGGSWLWVMASLDSGRTWSPPIDSGFVNPGSPAALLQLTSGNLLLVFNDSPFDRDPLTAAISADGGVTWPVRRNLAEGETTYSYPSVIQGPDGLIHVVFSVGRERIDMVTFNEAWLIDAPAVQRPIGSAQD